ncbi:MAG: ABC transporter ATP-binding protein/permease [Bacteroidia bacterium]|nr:ABC transporter ATP-binding protein/permease [Bacteroidia bacterium]
MKALFYLNKYFWKYKLRFFSGIIFILISTWFSLRPVDLVGQGLDFAAFAVEHKLPISAVSHILLMYGVEIIIHTLIFGFFLFLNRQTIIVMSRLIEYDMKNEVFEHYQKLDQGFYKRNNTGDLMNRISEDVSRVRMYTGPAVMYTITTLVTLVMTISFMLKADVKMTIYVLAPLPVLTFSIYFVSNLINRKSLRVQGQLSTLSTRAQEAFSGVRVVKAFAHENETQDRFANEAEEYRTRNMSLAKTEALFQPFMMLLIGLSIILTIYIGGKEVHAGKVSVGLITAFVLFVIRLTWPIASLGWVTSLVQRAAASQVRINEFLNTKPAVASITNEPMEFNGNVEFRDVSFTYPDSGIVALKNFSFSANAGQSVAILGHTGSGKSTVAQLLLRLYDPQSGNVFIDGKDIRNINLNAFRASTGYVPQDVFLFSDTIEENIRFNARKESQNDVEQAAKDAAIYSSIMEFPEGFKTMVGERGVTLSGGQKQRISIARAIVSHPKLLIFDDCLSAVDTETEEEILTNLRRIMKGKTTIIISHRVSSVRHADKIIVMEDGTIAEQGTHDELMHHHGIYRTLYDKQVSELQKKNDQN